MHVELMGTGSLGWMQGRTIPLRRREPLCSPSKRAKGSK
ncbi:hypothetical protein WCP94_001715 [Bilophila wadsworthia]